MKIGLFGGSFNPPHNGHLNSLQTVLKKLGLDKIYVIPTSQNPLKMELEGPTAEQRLEMVREALNSYEKFFILDDQEVKKGGVSYTIDTIANFEKTNPNDELYLIIGADNFADFSKWKDYKSILKKSNLIVTTRPGYDLPDSKEELPDYLQDLVEEYDFNFIELKTGKSVQFLNLKDLEISSSELRKWLRSSKPVEKYLPLTVENYIKKNKLYLPTADKVSDYKIFTEFCADVLFDKKGIQVRGFDLTKMTAPSEYALIVSGTSTRHTVAMSEHVVQAVKGEFGVRPLSVEGTDEGRWVVVDYGNLIVHIFYDFVRQEYSLENLWRQGVDMGLKDKALK